MGVRIGNKVQFVPMETGWVKLKNIILRQPEQGSAFFFFFFFGGGVILLKR